MTARQGYPFTVGLPGSDAEYSFLIGPPSITLDAAMTTPLPSVVAAVEPWDRRPAQEIVGTADVTGGKSNVGDAFAARNACSCDIVALSAEDAAEELTEAADSEDEDELEAADELAELEELELLEDAEELDPGLAALSLLDTLKGPLESVLVPLPHAATSAEPADKPAKRRKSRRRYELMSTHPPYRECHRPRVVRCSCPSHATHSWGEFSTATRRARAHRRRRRQTGRDTPAE